jgi:hypothetical protein
MDTETIAKALGNAKQVNGQWVCSCPVPGHGQGNGDKNPSLSITESEGKVLFHCHESATSNSCIPRATIMGGVSSSS